MQELLTEYEEKLDHTNLLDVVYAVTNMQEADRFKQDEYHLYRFYTEQLLTRFKDIARFFARMCETVLS